MGGGLDQAVVAAREPIAEAEQALRAAAARSRQVASQLKQEGLSGRDNRPSSLPLASCRRVKITFNTAHALRVALRTSLERDPPRQEIGAYQEDRQMHAN